MREYFLSKVEVYLNQSQIKNLKHILEQSEMGFHLLFDNHDIAHAFKTNVTEDDFFQVENIKLVQNDLLKLLQLKSLTDKQEFVRCLPQENKERLIRAYFYIIENNLKNSKKQLTH